MKRFSNNADPNTYKRVIINNVVRLYITRSWFKRLFNINTIGTALLLATVAAIIVLFICSNGNYIAHVSINN